MADLALISRLAPIVRLHPSDEHRPASVPWYLPNVRMRFHRSWQKDRAILDRGAVSDATIASQSCEDQSSGGARPSDFFLEIAGDEDRVRRGDLASALAYAHVLTWPEFEDIQYWFFYPYNGDMGPGPINFAHEGDWEHVTLRVACGRVTRAFFSAHHKEGKVLDAARCAFVGERLVVYSARHSHASYPTGGKQARNNLPDDHTADLGPEWRTWERLEWLDPHPPRWLRYSGHWGEIGEFKDTTGPRGPSHQRAWSGDPELGIPAPPGGGDDDPRGEDGPRGGGHPRIIRDV